MTSTLPLFWVSFLTDKNISERLYRSSMCCKNENSFVSHSGKLIGGFCALSGVFILTLPIPIVVNSFAQFYKNRLWRNEVQISLSVKIVEMRRN